ncbi:unnamed protein product [Phytophthora fragariaefolia]|uniref:Unnamed protein product n=1 Tax=Phytophthora fragariaefolia TaxID=1490495 RepID=A0A9W6YEX7_9STRA|nr:unnamed protein product [Phytophthora fragariaefolia]
MDAQSVSRYRNREDVAWCSGSAALGLVDGGGAACVACAGLVDASAMAKSLHHVTDDETDSVSASDWSTPGGCTHELN